MVDDHHRRKSSLEREAELNDLFDEFDSYTFQRKYETQGDESSVTHSSMSKCSESSQPIKAKTKPKIKNEPASCTKVMSSQISNVSYKSNSLDKQPDSLRGHELSQATEKEKSEIKVPKPLR